MQLGQFKHLWQFNSDPMQVSSAKKANPISGPILHLNCYAVCIDNSRGGKVQRWRIKDSHTQYGTKDDTNDPEKTSPERIPPGHEKRLANDDSHVLPMQYENISGASWGTFGVCSYITVRRLLFDVFHPATTSRVSLNRRLSCALAEARAAPAADESTDVTSWRSIRSQFSGLVVTDLAWQVGVDRTRQNIIRETRKNHWKLKQCSSPIQ